ncbi:MAG: hypothetical protein EPO61_11705 [Nitrospirae bacterium]|nr:MAG: hypothetical protein EPO61_11705 [Nitrospirota bacterium]
MRGLSLPRTELESASGVEQRLLDALTVKGAQTMEQLASLQPTVSWAQVFLAIDRLSRSGLVFLRRDGGCRYCVSLNRTGEGAI